MPADPAILLDVTRLVSRLNQGPATGIDRVEAEWLSHLQSSRAPHLLLARARRAQLLLPPAAGAAILRWSAGDGAGLATPDLFDRLRGRRDMRARAEATLRRMAIYRAGRTGRGIARKVAQHLGHAAYLNVGHSNLTADLWAGLAPLPRVALIHDTIPLDHPEFTRAGQSEKFRERLVAALKHAGLVLTVSDATRADVLRWRDRLNLPEVPIVAAPIGTRLAAPDPTGLPQGLDLCRPFFVTLGTIEPRKNHAILLDAWERLGPDAPQLFIIGRRGWENHETFARLDRLPPDSPIRVLTTLDDGAVAELIGRSHALLMPSRAEGFGLPLTEAAARGGPVVCTRLPAAREMLGDYACYLCPDDAGAWADQVAALASGDLLRKVARPVPEWDAHFHLVRQVLRERLHAEVVKGMPVKKR
ncbi:glycosyltransferase family 4 protein [Paracoccus laeviglucosivorans]|uniref:Glycosyl transferases group 1 n=1 Tax=Paracoccus laeviglucosivorans TaxID=1197861 RepID=A0A521FNV6_9RHOB|nr:glycosyltransferase family 1 protein [Paracoccus laeviglucosivorans]SMO97887.1 Glycosyl transferases group 1 [Paracoccus laeviglucosivorans]